jgi:hypothetical protein
MLRLFILALLVAPVAMNAADYYVAPNGLDANPGTEAQPWRNLQRAANAGAVAPGDTVYVRAGAYSERVTIQVSGSAAGGFITFRNYPGETPILDATGVTPPTTDTGLFLIDGRSYIRIQGFELRNYQSLAATTNQNHVPCGIHLRGACDHVEIRSCQIHDIWNHFADGNAFGIVAYGDAAAPMTNLLIDGNEVYQCRTGNSETIAINGNVNGWQVSNNLVHDNTNIGIDAIGYEETCCGGTSDPILDRARNGVIRGNTVWNCSSAGTAATSVPSNPAYGGLPGAGGIYVDGGRDIVIEGNISFQNDIGIELASEHSGKATESVSVRGNTVWRNKIGGLFLGGSGSANGSATNNVITGNTFWENDTSQDGNGEIQFQYRVFNTVVRNNLVVANSQSLLLSNPVPALVGGQPANSGNDFNYNRWHAPAGSSAATWQWKNATKTGFPAWKTAAAGDANSTFGDPLFVNPTFTGTAPPARPDLHLRLDSPCLDAGDPAFLPAVGETDTDRGPRVTGPRVDIGSDELTPRDAWRVEKFGAAATSASAAFTADPDHDGLSNLLEFALAAEPLQASVSALPTASLSGGPGSSLTLTFTRSLAASDLTYTVEAAPLLGQWTAGSQYGPAGDAPTTAATTQISRTTANGRETIIVRDNIPLSAASFRFLRLRVSAP